MKRKAAIILFSFAALLFIYTACLYFIVPLLALKRAKAVALEKGYKIEVSEWKSSGISKIAFDSLLVSAESGDTIISVNHGKIGYSVFRYLRGHFPVERIYIDSVSVFKNLSNDTTAVTNTSEKKTRDGLAARLFRLEKKIIDNMPEEAIINHACITLQKNNNRRQWMLDNFKSDATGIKSILKSDDGTEISMNAKLNKSKGMYEFTAAMNGHHFIPATMDSNALQFSFRSASLVLTKESWSKSGINSHCQIKTEGLQLYHWRISQDTVKVNRFETNQQVIIHDNSISFSPSSSLTVNDISINTEIKIERKESTAISLKAEIPVMPSQAFFSSLPDGLFQSFKGIKAEGEVSYALNFSVDLSMPDSLTFESTFNGKKLKILQFGEVNPYRLNEPFEHTVYEKGRPVRRIIAGNENPHFVSYSHIPAVLVNCVLTAEDGSFFGHAGFNEEAFRQSIITNIKEKRFARGGSTISMQLIKNLYLGRDKNISRKMEEALWVWLIENKRMVSKERMMEIYLNIIEWGPDVYGIGEAAQYYFNKKADQLSLNECIFLAGIIPNPKYFRYAFDKEGNLRNYFQSFFRIVSERLLMKEKITEQEFSTVSASVKLTGRAAALVMPADSLPDFDVQDQEEEMP